MWERGASILLAGNPQKCVQPLNVSLYNSVSTHLEHRLANRPDTHTRTTDNNTNAHTSRHTYTQIQHKIGWAEETGAILFPSCWWTGNFALHTHSSFSLPYLALAVWEGLLASSFNGFWEGDEDRGCEEYAIQIFSPSLAPTSSHSPTPSSLGSVPRLNQSQNGGIAQSDTTGPKRAAFKRACSLPLSTSFSPIQCGFSVFQGFPPRCSKLWQCNSTN